MKPMLRVYLLDEDGEKVFGEGPYRLLCALEETGSLRSAAHSMEMAYSKALRILNRAEKALGCTLADRSAGGSRGGGSRLTDDGRAFLQKYEKFRALCLRAGEESYEQIFKA